MLARALHARTVQLVALQVMMLIKRMDRCTAQLKPLVCSERKAASSWWLICSERKVLLASSRWLICFERKVLLVGSWWLICSERKVLWLAVDKPSEQGVGRTDYISELSELSRRRYRRQHLELAEAHQVAAHRLRMGIGC
jgi:hypothetical protein